DSGGNGSNGSGPGGDSGNMVDQFSADARSDILGASDVGGAFAAFTGSAFIAGQAAILQIDGNEFQLQAPASLDGFFTEPPQSIVDQLRDSLGVNSWTELAAAIDFGGASIIVQSDGPYAISLDGVPPDELLAILTDSLLVDAAKELLDALEIALVIPLTAMDGPVSILTISVPVDPETLALLGSLLDDAAFSELTSALDG
ncbi:MAG: hypothetical protein AAF236_12850, partial [Verrucomicrobiota bacterium]